MVEEEDYVDDKGMEDGWSDEVEVRETMAAVNHCQRTISDYLQQTTCVDLLKCVLGGEGVRRKGGRERNIEVLTLTNTLSLLPFT